MKLHALLYFPIDLYKFWIFTAISYLTLILVFSVTAVSLHTSAHPSSVKLMCWPIRGHEKLIYILAHLFFMLLGRVHLIPLYMGKWSDVLHGFQFIWLVCDLSNLMCSDKFVIL
jgi:hypothetical protein